MDTLNLTQLDLKGSLKDFPIEVVKEMLKNQKIQTGKVDVSIFEKYITASDVDGGFHWESTEEGHEYWNRIINDKDISEFIPYQNGVFSNPTESDLILDLKGFPLPLVKLMVNEQILQGNNPCFKVFQLDVESQADYGGFDWKKSDHGEIFWDYAINLARSGELMTAIAKIIEKYPDILNKD